MAKKTRAFRFVCVFLRWPAVDSTRKMAHTQHTPRTGHQEMAVKGSSVDRIGAGPRGPRDTPPGSRTPPIATGKSPSFLPGGCSLSRTRLFVVGRVGGWDVGWVRAGGFKCTTGVVIHCCIIAAEGRFRLIATLELILTYFQCAWI